jgi:hypothetical protein
VIKFVSDLRQVGGFLLSPGTPVSSINKTDHHDITEILLKVALNTITTRSPLLMNRKPTMMANNCNNIKAKVLLLFLIK